MTNSTKKTVSAEWLEAHVGYQGDECLIWPFSMSADGYGYARHECKTVQAHRLMCIFAHGKPDGSKFACHSCGNGHIGCVNPRHLSWKTQKENWDDRKRHGVPTNSNRGRLTYAERMKSSFWRGGVESRHAASLGRGACPSGVSGPMSPQSDSRPTLSAKDRK